MMSADHPGDAACAPAAQQQPPRPHPRWRCQGSTRPPHLAPACPAAWQPAQLPWRPPGQRRRRAPPWLCCWPLQQLPGSSHRAQGWRGWQWPCRAAWQGAATVGAYCSRLITMDGSRTRLPLPPHLPVHADRPPLPQAPKEGWYSSARACPSSRASLAATRHAHAPDRHAVGGPLGPECQVRLKVSGARLSWWRLGSGSPGHGVCGPWGQAHARRAHWLENLGEGDWLARLPLTWLAARGACTIRRRAAGAHLPQPAPRQHRRRGRVLPGWRRHWRPSICHAA
jgi:hypothetical protein